MKTDNKALKLSPLEELRQRKLVLQQECQKDEERFFRVVDDVRGNWRSLLIGSLFSSSKSLVSSFFSSPRTDKNSATAASGGALPKLIPVVWAVLQPILMKIAMNKIKSLFTQKKR